MRHLFTVFSLTIVLLGALPLAAASDDRNLNGIVVDPAGRAVAAARVVLQAPGMPAKESVTDVFGRFAFREVPTGAVVTVTAPGFEISRLEIADEPAEMRVVLSSAVVAEKITVVAPRPIPTRSMTSTRTDTPLRDVPQAVTVITREAISQQAMRGIADVVRYAPGIGIAQGEGNRDTPVFRGNSSTADFFIDGIRDDVQYLRDLYNVERVEILKGPNAMIFGRGGIGGILNRVTRQAEWATTRELTLQTGSWSTGRVAADFGQAFNQNLAARVTAMYEDSESYRSGYQLTRHGINPTLAFALGSNTIVRAGFEYFHDDRTADRGVSSFRGKPVATAPSTFFGNADLSYARATVNAFASSLDHRFNDRLTLRSSLRFGDYEKFYQNVFPGPVDAAGENVRIQGYNNATDRQNLFSQTDLVFSQRTGRLGHTIVAGVELGRQVTDNFRQTGYFTTVGQNVTSVMAPLSDPAVAIPVTFRQSASDADNHGTADVAAIYVQDQIAISPRLQATAGLRYDNFSVDFRNNRTGANFESNDGLVSPRVGLVYKPAEPVSLYASYSISYLPRAGEQLSSLNLSNQSLEPEEFRNYEVGAKWEIARALEFTAAVYRLDRANVAVADPTNPTVSRLVKGQQTEGLELSVNGNLTRNWSVLGAYAFQDGEIVQSLSSSARAGARIAQLPEHSFSIWNKYDVSPMWALGLGIIHRDEIFTSTDNSVTVPAFTRADGAVFFTLSPRLRAQLNVENLFDTDYYAFAHNNTNITPGSPRAMRLSFVTRF